MFVGVTTLAKELAAALLFRDAHMLKGVYGGLAGLYEWLWDQAAPGATSQTVAGEDHSAVSRDGGIPIPRNCFISAGYGSADQFMWKLAGINSADGYLSADNSYSPTRSSDLGYHWTGFVEPGLDSPSNAGLYAEALVLLSTSASNLSVRIENTTLSQYSAVTTLTAAGLALEFVLITDIPISEDRFNDMLLEFSTTEEGIDVWLYGVQFYTVYKAGAESRSALSTPKSQPASAGTEVP